MLDPPDNPGGASSPVERIEMQAYEREDLAELIIRAINAAREYGRSSGNSRSDLGTILLAASKADLASHQVWAALYEIRVDDGSPAPSAPRAGVSQPPANLTDEPAPTALSDPE